MAEEEQPLRRRSIFPFFPRNSLIGAIRDRVTQNPIIGKQLDSTRESIMRNVAQMPGNVITGATYKKLKERFG